MAENENPSTPPRRVLLPSQEFAAVINGNIIKLQSIKPNLLNAGEISGILVLTFLTVARQVAALTEQLEGRENHDNTDDNSGSAG